MKIPLQIMLVFLALVDLFATIVCMDNTNNVIYIYSSIILVFLKQGKMNTLLISISLSRSEKGGKATFETFIKS